MSNVTSLVMTTVCAPYKAKPDACTLAGSLASIEMAQAMIGPVYAFFSEVKPEMQKTFLAEWGISEQDAAVVAKYISAQAGQDLPLAG